MEGYALDPPTFSGPTTPDNNPPDHSAPCDGGPDQRVKLLVPPSSELQLSGSDSLHPQILTGVTSQFLAVIPVAYLSRMWFDDWWLPYCPPFTGDVHVPIKSLG